MANSSNKAIISVIGVDTVGIIAKISGKCSDFKVNILDITQKVFENTFAMIMLVDTAVMELGFAEFVQEMKRLGEELGVVIHATHEDIFNAMHRI